MTDPEINQLEEKYRTMSDESLSNEVAKKQNDIALDCLIERYKEIVNMKANKFFMIGSEKEDMIQEGYIGLYKAVKSYNQEKQNSFKTFAGLCIERQMITAVKNSNRQKHLPLNTSLSLNAGAFNNDDNDIQIMEILDTRRTGEDPLDIITQKDYFSVIEKEIDENLSDFEKKVLNHYKNGESYSEIAEKLKSKIKSVDTAIQRIRKKAIKIRKKLEGEAKNSY